MSPVRIVTDGAADLPDGVAESLGVRVVRGPAHLNGSDWHGTIDEFWRAPPTCELGRDLDALARRLQRLYKSFTWAGPTASREDHAAWVEALGWFAGWDFPYRVLAPGRKHDRYDESAEISSGDGSRRDRLCRSNRPPWADGSCGQGAAMAEVRMPREMQDGPEPGGRFDPVRPDYQGACLSRLVPTLLAGSDASWLLPEVREASSVVILVVDGLGSTMLDVGRRAMPTLCSLPTRTLTTVVPSTTASALTSLVTGAPPAEHGLVGYRMRVEDGILDVLKWKLAGGRDAASPESVAPLLAFAGVPVPVITRRRFRTGGFTTAHLRGARLLGWKFLSSLVVHCRQLAEAKEPLVVAYYDGLDWVAHRYGLRDTFFPAELGGVDDLVGDLLTALPRGTALLVTGDHGHVHLEEHRTIDGLAGLVDGYAGDARFRYLYARPGAAADLEAAAREQCGDEAWVLSRTRLIDEGWFGPNPPAPGVAYRIGDVVLAARRPVAFLDPTHPIEAQLQSAHGSLTADEMLVPLVLGWGESR